MKCEEAVRQHLRSTSAIVLHVLEDVERQLGSEAVRERPDVNELVIRLERVLKAQAAELESLIESFGAPRTALLRKSVMGAVDMLAGLYYKTREHKISRFLSEDYISLNKAAVSYAMLHTFGVASGQENVADVAMRHLKSLPPLLDRIRTILPHVISAEIADQDEFSVVSDAGPRAVANLAGIWSGELPDENQRMRQEELPEIE